MQQGCSLPSAEATGRISLTDFHPLGVRAVRLVVMLSIAKLRLGQEAYQLSGVAQSLDDYYTGAGETHGVWVGGGAGRLGLDGDVEPDDVSAVLAGLGPGWGGLTPNGEQPRPHRRRVPGFDLTFKAPKSASVLYAVSDDPRVQGAVIEAGEAAMRAALGWLEREALRVRRGSHNQAWLAAHSDQPRPRQLRTSGVVGASFRHRTSRAGDPLLHWHVLVANMAEGTDGRWSALYGQDLYRHARAAGEVFQAEFRHQLTASLGVEWRPGRHVPEIAGIPQALLDGFSKRSSEVDAWLAARGTPDTRESRQAAVLATRRHKPEVERERFDAAWKAEAEQAGWGPDAAERLIGWSQQRAGHTVEGCWRLEDVVFDGNGRAQHVERLVDPDEWIAHLVRSELTATASTFTEADLIRAVAARQGAGATVETIERIASRVLGSDLVVAVATLAGEPQRWTSRELVDVEARFLATVTAPPTHDPLPAAAVQRAVADRPSLGADQLAAVRALAADGHSVAVLVGPAGTGKTFTLDTVRGAFQHAGVTVVGAAPSARAALELTAGAGIPARTLHSLLDTWGRGYNQPTSESLLVVDEAGMADIRTLEAVVTRHVAAGGRVLLVGDHHQLPEVGAGGGFAAATVHAGCVTELSVNRRQHQPWEQTALAQLRNGSVAHAVEAYLARGRVHVTDTRDAMVAAAVEQWFAARDTGLDPVLLAGTNDLVDRLNQAVIDRLAECDEVDHCPVTFGPGTFRNGQRIVVRRNSREYTTGGQPVDIANGHSGVIVAAAPGELNVRLDHNGAALVLTERYLARGGHLTHAYALTSHRAQGGTWDLAIAVGADGLYREGAYVNLSRGANENTLILTDPEAAELHRRATEELVRHDSGLTPPDDEPPDTHDDLIERVSRSHAKHIAHTLDPDLAVVDRLADTFTMRDLETRHAGALAAEHAAADIHGIHADQLTARLARAAHVARHLAVGARVSPADRHNVGVIVALDDTTGRATVEFVSAAGRHATRSFDWADLRLLDPAEPRRLPPAAHHRLAAITTELTEQIGQLQATVRQGGAEPGDARRYRQAIDRHLQRHTLNLTAERPAWLTHLLGSRPDDVAGATAWDDALRDIATWRARHDLGDDVPGLGDRAAASTDAAGWDALQTRLADTRIWLAASDRIHPAQTVVPSYGELLERRAELDASFAQAPADWRSTLTELRTGQLTLDATTDLLRAAVDGQQARRDWILANWPHVVEYQEINRTLTTGTWGPDPHLLNDLLTQPLVSTLAAAIEGEDPWLRAALCAVADGDTTVLARESIDWLERVAAARAEHGVPASAALDWTTWSPRATADVMGDIDEAASSIVDSIDL
jgi:conjugative relaxase-like TrwC/TraI family protein